MNVSKNRKFIQSQEMLMQATFDLMNHKKYEEITIKDIAERAQVDRRTFYRHFKTKDDLLILYMKEIGEEYKEELKKVTALDSYHISLIFFRVCEKHLPFLYLLNNNNLMNLLLYEVNHILPELHRLFITPEFKAQHSKDLNYILSFHAGGFWNILIEWIRNGADSTPEELAAIIKSILLRLI